MPVPGWRRRERRCCGASRRSSTRSTRTASRSWRPSSAARSTLVALEEARRGGARLLAYPAAENGVARARAERAVERVDGRAAELHLHLRIGGARQLGQPGGYLDRTRDHPVALDDLIHEPELKRLLGREQLGA